MSWLASYSPLLGPALLGSLASLFCACSPEASSDHPSIPHFVWSTQVTVDQKGVSPTFVVPRDQDAPATWIRISGSGAAPACVQLHHAKGAEGLDLVSEPTRAEDFGPYCVSCPQRAAVGYGFGLYPLPNDGLATLRGSKLWLNVAYRSCATFTPLWSEDAPSPLPQLVVETMDLRAPRADEKGRLHLTWVVTSQSPLFAVSRPDVHELLRASQEQLKQIFAPAKLDLEVAIQRMEIPPDPLVFGPGDYAALDQLYQSLGPFPRHTVPIFFVGCLRLESELLRLWEEPDGFTLRIPGGLVTSDVADGIFIKGRSCSAHSVPVPWTAHSLATIVAHELGHFLGLFHTRESSGQEDHLDDTDDDNLMFYAPFLSQSRRLSARQVRILRSHPLARW